jgi:hypothetical protein
MTPKFELLKEAYAILGGIPSKVINLNSIQEKEGKALSCGTICCGIGWLGHHPKFQALGLKTKENGVSYKGEDSYYEDAASNLFNIDYKSAEELFAPGYDICNSLEKGASPLLSHKQRLLYRFRTYLRRHGQLKHQLAKKARKELDVQAI